MSDKHYKVKPRPNVFELAILEGFLNGGGDLPNVQREAYWAEEPRDKADSYIR